jgi:hypothetical protein
MVTLVREHANAFSEANTPPCFVSPPTIDHKIYDSPQHKQSHWLLSFVRDLQSQDTDCMHLEHFQNQIPRDLGQDQHEVGAG